MRRSKLLTVSVYIYIYCINFFLTFFYHSFHHLITTSHLIKGIIIISHLGWNRRGGDEGPQIRNQTIPTRPTSPLPFNIMRKYIISSVVLVTPKGACLCQRNLLKTFGFAWLARRQVRLLGFSFFYSLSLMKPTQRTTEPNSLVLLPGDGETYSGRKRTAFIVG